MKMLTRVLFIDDEKHIRLANRQTLELAELEVTTLATAEEALECIAVDWPGVLVCDIRLPGMSGMELQEKLQTIDRDLPIIFITGHGDVSTAVKAMRNGAYDFLEKPYSSERLVKSVMRALEKRMLTLENRQLRTELEAHSAPGPRIIGKTAATQRLRATIAQIADTGADVLLVGETGTGKELVARSLHEHSQRRNNNFVAVNCGAIAESMIESELLGHEAGAFTDAKSRRVGKFEYANGGTLLLDEIESMPMQMQVSLLRVLQERVVERLGSNTTIPLDLRVVAAAKIDLKEASDQGEFRKDLYYRLNVVCIDIPPLRSRREDVPLLFHHYLLVAGHRYQKEVPAPPSSEVNRLMAYDWPGNVRELRNLAERYVLLGSQVGWSIDRLLSWDVAEISGSLNQQVELFEKTLLEQALAAHKGSLKEVMAALSLPRKTLYDKLQKHGLDKNDFK